jgi:hypothetical protein
MACSTGSAWGSATTSMTNLGWHSRQELQTAISFIVNGKPQRVDVSPDMPQTPGFARPLGLTGAKFDSGWRSVASAQFTSRALPLAPALRGFPASQGKRSR